MRSLLASQQTFVDRLVQLMKAVQRESGNRKKKVWNISCRSWGIFCKVFCYVSFFSVSDRRSGYRACWLIMRRWICQRSSQSLSLWNPKSASKASYLRLQHSLRYCASFISIPLSLTCIHPPLTAVFVSFRVLWCQQSLSLRQRMGSNIQSSLNMEMTWGRTSSSCRLFHSWIRSKELIKS